MIRFLDDVTQGCVFLQLDRTSLIRNALSCFTVTTLTISQQSTRIVLVTLCPRGPFFCQVDILLLPALTSCCCSSQTLGSPPSQPATASPHTAFILFFLLLTLNLQSWVSIRRTWGSPMLRLVRSWAFQPFWCGTSCTISLGLEPWGDCQVK